MSRQPYIRREPGDLITAEDWNAMQERIQEDMETRGEALRTRITQEGVSRADNAEQFDKRTPKEWVERLDERYSLKIHDHEGRAVYRRYFKRIRPGQTVVLNHQLGRFPLVDVYELLEVLNTQPWAPLNLLEKEEREKMEEIRKELVVTGGGAPPTKFYLYYHHEERERDRLFTEDRGMVRAPWGIPFEAMLDEYDVEWEDDDTLGDVYNDFLQAFFKPPWVDPMEYAVSPWINERRRMKIAELKVNDEWDDIRWVMRPVSLLYGRLPGDQEVPGDVPWWLDVAQLSYDAIALRLLTGRQQINLRVTNVDLMILLRS